MLLVLTLVSPDPAATQAAVQKALRALAAAGGRVKEPLTLGPGALDLLIEAPGPREAPGLRAGAEASVADLPVDFALQPVAGRRKRLLVADMDSTIIGCECLDELADYAGVKAEVAAVTERAMAGEIPFESALRQRVALLRGLPVSALKACLDERVRLNPGARTLTATMAAHGGRTVLVSGGFDVFAEPVAAEAGFHAFRANVLLKDGAQLTGGVAEPILGRDAKRAALLEELCALGLEPAAAAAVGDGANDLAMIETAGLGVAYRAKPVVAAKADARIAHGDLTALLYFQGYARNAFVESGR